MSPFTVRRSDNRSESALLILHY